MALIVKLPLFDASDGAAADPWRGIVAQARQWGQSRDIDWRDALFLVPTAQHLPLARRAWARVGGWMPRIETSMTLARGLAAAPTARAPLGLSFDASADRLSAAALLRDEPWAAAWAQRDPHGWSQALDALVTTAQAFWRAAAALAPAARPGYWQHGSAALAARLQHAGPGVAERALARLAFEWAQAALLVPPATDVLFTLSPSAWVRVDAGGVDPLVDNLLQAAAAAGTACLVIDTDPPAGKPLSPAATAAPLQVAVCGDFEDEAQRAAAQVLADVAAACATPQRLPVALISLDRMLIRRIRALLARRGVVVTDETGWTLSTTRAAASLAGLLAAVQPQASADELLNGLRSCAGRWPGLAHGRGGLASLEAAMRRYGWSRAAAIDAARLAPAALALWHACGEVGRVFDAGAAARPLSAWMDRLQALLDRCGLAPRLKADEAGRQVLAALVGSAGWAPGGQALAAGGSAADTGVGRGVIGRSTDAAGIAHGGLSASDRLGDVGQTANAASMTRPQFVDWLEQVLEAAAFVPAAPAQPHVVITPLRRAMLRPFAAIVVPGADDRHLGGPPPRQQLLSDAEAAEFGLPDSAWHRERETLGFAQLLRGGTPVSVLHRLDDAGEPLAASPLLARLLLARSAAGVGWQVAADRRVELATGVQPVPRPLPVAAALLPDRLSASACEALRSCPYRFFALRVLALKESAELDAEVEKRDYGSWLHAVLHRFHVQQAERADGAEADPAQRGAGQRSAPDADAQAADLHAVATELLRQSGLDAAAFLPFSASFERFVPRYIRWLHRRDAAGARWLDGEREFSVAPAAWGGTLMHGVIDRIDSVNGESGPLTQLIDYKTGSAQALRKAVERPQEDTQLAFYAGLLMTQSAAVGGVGELSAMYLALDEPDALGEVPHADVERSARQLIHGIGGDLARLRQGAAMPALGEGRACDFCEARGLCRRDQWAPV